VFRWATLGLAVLPAFGRAQEAQPEPGPRTVGQQEVNEAIDHGVRWLLANQGPDGSWFEKRPGRTALVLYALLKSGVDPQSPAVKRALEFLAEHDSQQTYDAAILAMVLAALDDPEYQEWIEVLAERLIAWQLKSGDWAYPEGDGDLSNTQYAALGLWAAGKTGVKVPAEVWEELFGALQRYVTREGSFGYKRGDRDATPSMTAAGVGTLALCAWGLQHAGALAPRTDRQIERAKERGLEWLAERFEDALSTTFGFWPYYRLYGIERVGALAKVAKLGERDWYQEGAARLVEEQRKDGSWSPRADPAAPGARGGRRGDASVDINTAFALLFLRRATSLTALDSPSATEASSPNPDAPRRAGPSQQRQFFGTASADDDVQVRAIGRDPLTIWITGWGPHARERLEWTGQKGRGPHVSLVEYLVDGEVVASLPSDPLEPVEIERFEHRFHLPRSGAFRVQARATVHAAPAAGGKEPGPGEVLTSKPFEVEVAGVRPEWLREQAGDRALNLLPAAEPTVRASSALREDGRDYRPELAVDNRTLTAWLARPEDATPTLEIDLGRPTLVSAILISAPRTVPYEAGHFARPMEVEIVLNGKDAHVVRMPKEERQKARLELAEPVRLLSLTVKVTWKGLGKVESTGLADVELQHR
jgi:hypothetical protein